MKARPNVISIRANPVETADIELQNWGRMLKIRVCIIFSIFKFSNDCAFVSTFFPGQDWKGSFCFTCLIRRDTSCCHKFTHFYLVNLTTYVYMLYIFVKPLHALSSRNWIIIFMNIWPQNLYDLTWYENVDYEMCIMYVCIWDWTRVGKFEGASQSRFKWLLATFYLHFCTLLNSTWPPQPHLPASCWPSAIGRWSWGDLLLCVNWISVTPTLRKNSASF